MQNEANKDYRKHGNQPDYRVIDYDPETPEKWDYVERRAALLDHVISVGSPYGFSRSEFARRCEVNPSTVTRDMSAIGKAIGESMEYEAETLAYSVFSDSLAKLQEAGETDWRAAQAAFAATRDYLEWLGETGRVETEPSKLDVRMRETDAVSVSFDGE